MLGVLARNWWVLALRGALAILLGIFLFLFPPLVVETLVIVFGAYAFIDGVAGIWTAIQNRNRERWWLALLEGVLGVFAGVVVFAYPMFATVTATLFVLYIISFWAITTGIMEIWAAIQLRKEISNELWLGLSGLLSLIFGVALILFPSTGVLAVLTLIAVYAILFGVMLLMLAFRLRSHQGTGQTAAGQHA